MNDCCAAPAPRMCVHGWGPTVSHTSNVDQHRTKHHISHHPILSARPRPQPASRPRCCHSHIGKWKVESAVLVDARMGVWEPDGRSVLVSGATTDVLMDPSIHTRRHPPLSIHGVHMPVHALLPAQHRTTDTHPTCRVRCRHVWHADASAIHASPLQCDIKHLNTIKATESGLK